MNRLPTGPNMTPTIIFNPRLGNVSYKFAEEDGSQKEYTLYALEAITLPYYLAHKIANLLADKIQGERGQRKNYQADHEEILKEILI